MKKNKILLSIVALAAISMVSLGAINYASAAQINKGKKAQIFTAEERTTMRTAVENNDYNAWKAVAQDKGKISQVINETNFAKFAEAHKLAKEGKIQEAKAIKKELGLRINKGHKRGNVCNCSIAK